jgi:hypothetical protein
MSRYSFGTRVTNPVSNMTEFEAEKPGKARSDGEQFHRTTCSRRRVYGCYSLPQ